jgi:hypothetical protein
MIFQTPERVAALTPAYPLERSADGRPRVPDDILERMRRVTNDEAWGVLERGHGYQFQFEGGWTNLHPERILVGRAVTVRMVPLRPDLQEVVQGVGAGEGRSGGQNTWVIDTLEEGDVLVVDLFGKIETAPSSATTWRPRSRPGPGPASSSTAASATWSGSSNFRISTSIAAASTRPRSST